MNDSASAGRSVQFFFLFEPWMYLAAWCPSSSEHGQLNATDFRLENREMNSKWRLTSENPIQPNVTDWGARYTLTNLTNYEVFLFSCLTHFAKSYFQFSSPAQGAMPKRRYIQRVCNFIKQISIEPFTHPKSRYYGAMELCKYGSRIVWSTGSFLEVFGFRWCTHLSLWLSFTKGLLQCSHILEIDLLFIPKNFESPFL